MTFASDVVNYVVPTSNIDAIVLDQVSVTMSPMTVTSALLFQGHLDVDLFESAITTALLYCPWIAGELSVQEDGVLRVIPRPRLEESSADFDGYVCCEFDDRSENPYDAAVDIPSLLPQKVHTKMSRVDLALASVDELPISAFRLTKFANHFTIGYSLNHAFFDQASIVYFFTFLADLYSHGGSPTIAPPVFRPRSVLVKEPLADIEDFRRAIPVGYTEAPMTGLSFGTPNSLSLVLVNEAFNKLRASNEAIAAGNHLSSNDIIHSVLLQAIVRAKANADTGASYPNNSDSKAQVTTDATETTKKQFRLLYARNMRSIFGFGDDSAGDYVRLQMLAYEPEGGALPDLISLAAANRATLHNPAATMEYPRETAWFMDYPKYCGATNRPNSDFLADGNAVIVTNWSSFPYESIKFGDAVVMELLIKKTAFTTNCGAFVRVSFKITVEPSGERKRELVVVVDSLDATVVESVKSVATETGLFSIIETNPQL